MILTARLRGWRGNPASSAPIVGLGCEEADGSVWCELVYVARRTRATTIQANLIDDSQRRRVRLRWPGLEPGLHEGVTFEQVEKA
ncbi:hypothetical protein [Oceanithermus desulfurans]